MVKHSVQHFLCLQSYSKCFFIFSDILSSSIWKDINLLFLILNVLTYSISLGNIKNNGLITLSKYSIKYLELVFALTNFEITILSTLTSQILITFLASQNISVGIFRGVFRTLSNI